MRFCAFHCMSPPASTSAEDIVSQSSNPYSFLPSAVSLKSCVGKYAGLKLRTVLVAGKGGVRGEQRAGRNASAQRNALVQ